MGRAVDARSARLVRLRRIGSAALLGAALALAACGGESPAGCAEPPLQTDPGELEAALRCGAFDNPGKPAVLLVHGTFTAGFEQYDWTWRPILEAEGHDVCTVTYPDRGLGDMQRSAEYVVHALRRMHAESGRRVAVIGGAAGRGGGALGAEGSRTDQSVIGS